MGEPCWMIRGEDGVVLMVESDASSHVESELQAYAEENQLPSGLPLEEQPGGWWAPAVYAWALLLAYLRQTQAPREWIDRGSVSYHRLVEQHEWWRPWTALTLHGDLAHLASNIFFGLLFALPLQRMIGSGWMLWTFVITGSIGNVINTWLKAGESAGSIGASTAVFGFLGALVSVRITSWVLEHQRWRWREILLPLGAGAALLAMLGAQPADMFGQPIDNTAHFWGFTVGLGLGPVILATPLIRWRQGWRSTLLAWLAPVPFFLAWWWAGQGG